MEVPTLDNADLVSVFFLRARRALYLAVLGGVQVGDLRDDARERWLGNASQAASMKIQITEPMPTIQNRLLASEASSR